MEEKNHIKETEGLKKEARNQKEFRTRKRHFFSFISSDEQGWHS